MQVTNMPGLEKMVARKLRAAAESVVRAAKAIVPVGTGALQASIRVISVDARDGAVVGSDEEYAGDVEARTHFMEQALADAQNEIGAHL